MHPLLAPREHIVPLGQGKKFPRMKCRRTDPAQVLTHRNHIALLSGRPFIRKHPSRFSYFSGAVSADLHLSISNGKSP